jgi:hypothetical protein
MQLPERLIVAAAVILALPFGWGLGLLAAYIVAGKHFFFSCRQLQCSWASLLHSLWRYRLRLVQARGSR